MTSNLGSPLNRRRRKSRLLAPVLAGLLGLAAIAAGQQADPLGSPISDGTVPPAAAYQWTPPHDFSVDFEGALADSHNGEDFQETPGYRKLLELVRSWPESDFDSRALVRLDYEAAMADPDAWRGRLVTVRGILVHLRAEKLAQAIWDQIDSYRAIVTDGDGSDGVICDLLGPPPGLDLSNIELRRDLVDIDGVFYRTVRFENKKGDMTEAPYLIAKRIRMADEANAARSTKHDRYGLLLICAAVAFVVFRVAMGLHKRRLRSKPERPESLRNLFRDRLQSTSPPRRGPPHA